MGGKIGKSLLIVTAGVALSCVGFAVAAPELSAAPRPLRTLPLLGALAAVVVGVWLCWVGVARHIRPPEAASRIVDLLGVCLLAGLAIAAGILSITDFGIS